MEVPRVEHPAVARVRAALGNVPAPTDVWQKAFDYDEGHLERLVKLRRGELAEPYDLIEYALDFEYEEVQPDAPESLVAEQVLRDCRAREVEVSGHIKVLLEKLSGS